VGRPSSSTSPASTAPPSGRRILAERIAYRLGEVERVEVERFETGTTTSVIAAVLGAWLGLLVLSI